MGAIIWQKKTTTNTTGGASIMGSFPFPRNGILSIDYEFILIFKKLGIPKKPDNYLKEQSKITKEEWKDNYSEKEIGLRLDKTIDLDIDNRIAKRFVDKYIITCDAISGRPSNPKSHYWWKGQLEKAAFSLLKELKRYFQLTRKVLVLILFCFSIFNTCATYLCCNT
mgnify:CR=1 FL=1